MPILNNTKIPKESEQEICRLYLTGLSSIQIAALYNCSYSNICNICKRNGVMTNNRSYRVTTECDENYFENIDSPNKAYWLGFIIADGHISKNDSLVLRLNALDVEILEKFGKDLKSNYKIQKTKEYDKRTDKYYELCAVLIYRRKLAYDLAKLGITNNKSVELNLPDIPNHLVKYMLRGISDGDGGFHIDYLNNAKFKIRSSTKSVLEQIQNIFIKEANLNKTYVGFDSGCYALNYGGNINVRKIYNYLYDDLQGDLYLTRKYKYIKHHLDSLDLYIKSRNRNDRPLPQHEQTFRDGILLF